MPRRTASQLRISAAEKGRLKIDHASLRERRRKRLAYKVTHKEIVLSDPQNPARWSMP